MTESDEAFIPLPPNRKSMSLPLVYDGTRWVEYDALVERLTAGADPTPVEPGVWATPGQYIHHWNLMTEAERLAEAEYVMELKRAELYRLVKPPRHAYGSTGMDSADE